MFFVGAAGNTGEAETFERLHVLLVSLGHVTSDEVNSFISKALRKPIENIVELTAADIDILINVAMHDAICAAECAANGC